MKLLFELFAITCHKRYTDKQKKVFMDLVKTFCTENKFSFEKQKKEKSSFLLINEPLKKDIILICGYDTCEKMLLPSLFHYPLNVQKQNRTAKSNLITNIFCSFILLCIIALFVNQLSSYDFLGKLILIFLCLILCFCAMQFSKGFACSHNDSAHSSLTLAFSCLTNFNNDIGLILYPDSYNGKGILSVLSTFDIRNKKIICIDKLDGKETVLAIKKGNWKKVDFTMSSCTKIDSRVELLTSSPFTLFENLFYLASGDFDDNHDFFQPNVGRKSDQTVDFDFLDELFVNCVHLITKELK